MNATGIPVVKAFCIETFFGMLSKRAVGPLGPVGGGGGRGRQGGEGG